MNMYDVALWCKPCSTWPEYVEEIVCADWLEAIERVMSVHNLAWVARAAVSQVGERSISRYCSVRVGDDGLEGDCMAADEKDNQVYRGGYVHNL